MGLQNPAVHATIHWGRRLVGMVVAIWGVVTIVFIVMRLSGDPAVVLMPSGTPQSEIEHLRVTLGLDKPYPVQYFDFLRSIVAGDLGTSFTYRVPALPLVLQRATATLELVGLALGLGLLVGIPLGILAAFRRNRATDRAVALAALGGQSIPNFWLAPMLVVLFATTWHVLPASGRDGPASYILPVVSLALFEVGVVLRVVRGAGLEAITQDFMQLVRSKGAGSTRLAIAHLLPNLSGPLLSISGVSIAFMLGGSILIEQVFGWPGMGAMMVLAANNHDFPVVESVVLVYSAVYIGCNMIIDALYAVVDPRIRRSIEQRTA